MIAEFQLPEALKMAQWERAKGELRALVAIQGSYASGGEKTPEATRWVQLDEMVQDFIRCVEYEGLHE